MARVVTVDKVRGEPIQAYGRMLTPVARVVSIVRQRGTIGETQVSGGAGGYLYAKPVELIEERNGQVHLLPIPDGTGSALLRLAIVAALVPLLSLAVILVRRHACRR